jgi:hypothetical protein
MILMFVHDKIRSVGTEKIHGFVGTEKNDFNEFMTKIVPFMGVCDCAAAG